MIHRPILGTAKHTDSYERVLINFKAIPIPIDVMAQIDSSVANIKSERIAPAVERCADKAI